MSKIDKLPLLNDYDSIIFDMDGVLIDSEPLWKIAMEFVFGQYGSTLTHQDFQKTVGLRIDEVIAFWNIQENWKLSDLKNVENQIIDKLISLIEFDPKPLPGVLDTLQFLKLYRVFQRKCYSSFYITQPKISDWGIFFK